VQRISKIAHINKLRATLDHVICRSIGLQLLSDLQSPPSHVSGGVVGRLDYGVTCRNGRFRQFLNSAWVVSYSTSIDSVMVSVTIFEIFDA